MNDYDRVKLLGPKASRRVENQLLGLTLEHERFLLAVSLAPYGSKEWDDAKYMVHATYDAMLSLRAALMGVTLEWYKQNYCF